MGHRVVELLINNMLMCAIKFEHLSDEMRDEMTLIAIEINCKLLKGWHLLSILGILNSFCHTAADAASGYRQHQV